MFVPGFSATRPIASLQPTGVMVLTAYVVLCFASIVSLTPFLYILSTSIKETNSLFTYPPDWIPATLYWGNFAKLFGETNFVRWTLNTLFIGIAITLLKLIIDAMAAFSLAKLEFSEKIW